MESTLWSAPLVYRASEPPQNLEGTEIGRLTSTMLYLPNQQAIALNTVLGAEISPEPSQWILHHYPIHNQRYCYTPFIFSCPSAIASQDWVNAVNSALAQGKSQRRSLTVLLNPNSGNKSSLKIWREVQPIFEQAGCQVEVIQTQSAEDLRQQAQAIDLDTCTGLVILGGDGSIHYGVNGLMTHSDPTQARKLPLGFIPTGTSNGLVKSILDTAGLEYSVQNAAVAIALGKTSLLDLIQVKQETDKYFSVLSLSWGFFSDLDIESDRIKGLGFFKNYLYTLFLLITFRTYLGEVDIKTDAGWQRLPTNLITLWTMNVAWAAYNFKPAPNAKLNDATFDVWITPNQISRWQFLRILLKAFDGQHLDMTGVNSYKVQAIKVSPSNHQGIFAIDGEQVPYSSIELAVCDQPLTIFSPFF